MVKLSIPSAAETRPLFDTGHPGIPSEAALAALAWDLIAPSERLTREEVALLRGPRPAASPELLRHVRDQVLAGGDPLGDAFLQLRQPDRRRQLGATYTPGLVVRSMVAWAAQNADPARVVDPGAGSGRFLLEAAEAFPEADLIAVEFDPLAALLLRANIGIRGLHDRTQVIVSDYRCAAIPRIGSPTLFIGNPPYVRHHNIAREWKAWFSRTAAGFGVRASELAGLHIHFFLRTLELAAPGDTGLFITAAEWLDVNYGAVLRKLLCDGLGGRAIDMLDPRAAAFDGAMTTAAITAFEVGSTSPLMSLRRAASIDEFGALRGGRAVTRERATATRRWSELLDDPRDTPAGFVRLGDLFRVHRGQVTGANAVWIAGERAAALPQSVLKPAVTRAKELLACGSSLDRVTHLKRVVDLPPSLDGFDDAESAQIDDFLAWARSMGANRSYIATHRRPWWSVGLRAPAPILCTYMARRPPAFVRNLAGAYHVNIAHGLYPRGSLSNRALDAVVEYLRNNVHVSAGRAYAGGLTKFEPGEVEALLIPDPTGL